jgi:hypothetical protein
MHVFWQGMLPWFACLVKISGAVLVQDSVAEKSVLLGLDQFGLNERVLLNAYARFVKFNLFYLGASFHGIWACRSGLDQF